MQPALYRSRVGHSRTERLHSAFTYGLDMWLIDLDDVPRPFGPFARFEARDHLGDPGRTIRANVEAFLAGRGIDLHGGRVLLLTTPRSLGHAFNPLSIYWCHDPGGRIRCVIAEVHNTYGERHCYLLQPDARGWARADKQFYVSPFLSMGGRYELRVPPPDERLQVAAALRQGEETPFRAGLRGRRIRLTRRAVITAALRNPFVGYRIAALIRYEGIKLFLHRVPVVPRPVHPRQKGV